MKANVLDAPPSVSPIRAIAASKPRPTWYWKAKAGLAAAAAAVFVGVTIYRWPVGGPNGNANRQAGPIVASSAGWGWNRPEALSQDLSSKAYLIRLANVAHEWFNECPDNSADLAERISEFRQGCSALIQSPHRPFPLPTAPGSSTSAPPGRPSSTAIWRLSNRARSHQGPRRSR